MARRAARVDSNHGQIADFFRAHGCEVESLARLGNGVPDLLVSAPNTDKVALVEVKSEKGKRTPDQLKFSARFPVWIVRTDDDARHVAYWLRGWNHQGNFV